MLVNREVTVTMFTTICALLAIISATDALCFEEEDVARLCTSGTNLGLKLGHAVEECSQDCERDNRWRKCVVWTSSLYSYLFQLCEEVPATC